MVDPVICPHCDTPLDWTPCADATHRAYRDRPLTLAASLYFRECPNPDHRGNRMVPIGKFRHNGQTFKTCGTCRFHKRVARNQKRAGIWRAEKQRSDQYWEQQAQAHK